MLSVLVFAAIDEDLRWGEMIVVIRGVQLVISCATHHDLRQVLVGPGRTVVVSMFAVVMGTAIYHCCKLLLVLLFNHT